MKIRSLSIASSTIAALGLLAAASSCSSSEDDGPSNAAGMVGISGAVGAGGSVAGAAQAGAAQAGSPAGASAGGTAAGSGQAGAPTAGSSAGTGAGTPGMGAAGMGTAGSMSGSGGAAAGSGGMSTAGKSAGGAAGASGGATTAGSSGMGTGGALAACPSGVKTSTPTMCPAGMTGGCTSACGLADKGTRLCDCMGAGNTWRCDPCGASTLPAPTARPALCTGTEMELEADGAPMCTTAGAYCLPLAMTGGTTAMNNRICVCDAMLWDCDAIPAGWTIPAQ